MTQRVIGPVEYASPSQKDPAMRLVQYDAFDVGAILEVLKADGTKVAVVNGDGSLANAGGGVSSPTIHALTDGATPADTDEFPVARSTFIAGTERKLSWSAIKAAILSIVGWVNTFNVQNYGAKGDTLWAGDGAMVAGSAVLTSASSLFGSVLPGMAIVVNGAAGGGGLLTTTVLSVQSASQITLNATNQSGGNISSKAYVVGTDDTAAINAAIAAWVGHGMGTLLIPPANYFISGALTVAPVSTTGPQMNMLTISAYGANFHLTAANAGWVCHQASGQNWENFRFNGATCIVQANAVTNAFVFSDGSATGGFFNWEARDLTVMGGSAPAPGCNGIQVTQGQSTNVVYQFKLTNPTCTHMLTNVTGTGILIACASSGISSVEVTNPEVDGFKRGIVIGQTGHPVGNPQISKGTILRAQNEGIQCFVQGGFIDAPHIESCWQATPAGSLGANLYIEGWADVQAIDDHRDSGGNSIWAISVLASGPCVFSGQGPTQGAGPYIKVLGTNRAGTIITHGISPSQVDWSVNTSTTGPVLDLWAPKWRTDLTYSASMTPDASKGSIFRIIATDGNAMTINNPVNYVPGQIITFVIKNSSGSTMGTITWGGNLNIGSPFTNPAAGKTRTITLVQIGVSAGTENWVEIGRSELDIID